MEAFAQIAELNQEQHGGYSDWRLPNRNELRSLVSYQAKNPALPAGHPFINFFLGWYWSSTSAAINPAYAWAVHLEGARMFYGRKDQESLFWPVRGTSNGFLPATGQRQCFAADGRIIESAATDQDGGLRLGSPWPDPRFSVMDDVVHDRLTNLFWLKHADLTGEPVAWPQALENIARWGAKERGTRSIGDCRPSTNWHRSSIARPVCPPCRQATRSQGCTVKL